MALVLNIDELVLDVLLFLSLLFIILFQIDLFEYFLQLFLIYQCLVLLLFATLLYFQLYLFLRFNNLTALFIYLQRLVFFLFLHMSRELHPLLAVCILLALWLLEHFDPLLWGGHLPMSIHQLYLVVCFRTTSVSPSSVLVLWIV